MFRAAHSIKGGAGFFGLAKIQELAHKTENALDLIRSREMMPTPEVVSVLLLAFDKLRELIAQLIGRATRPTSESLSQALTALDPGSLPAEREGLPGRAGRRLTYRRRTSTFRSRRSI